MPNKYNKWFLVLQDNLQCGRKSKVTVWTGAVTYKH